uniref:Immunoglobulin V-set domain-containing protein n=1 Tax=Panthera tigris altaica TaxID=74533 RepID=A0A8C9KCV9_PANTA
MEPPSALPRGGRVPWQELLLAVSLLTFWNPPTTAQVTVELVPPNAAEGKDVLLRVHNLPVNLLGFGWFKGETVEPRSEIVSYAADSQEITPGLAHSGRETLYHNGSLLFQNINLEDTGYYTVRILKRNFQIEIVTRRLRVYHGRSPTGLPVGTNVGIAIGVLVGGALVAALGYLLVRVKTGSGQRNHREMGHPACTPGEYPFSPGSTGTVPIYQVSVGNECSGPPSPRGLRICPQPALFRTQQ